MSFSSNNLSHFPAMLATAQNGGQTAYLTINNMFPASSSSSSLSNTPGTILPMPTNIFPPPSSSQSINTTPFLLPSNNFTTNPTNLTCTIPLSSPPQQLQTPMLSPFFIPASGNLFQSSNSSNLSIPSPFGSGSSPMPHFLSPGHSNNNSNHNNPLPIFSSAVSSSGSLSTVPVSLYHPSSNQISLTSVSSNLLSSSSSSSQQQPMILPTLPITFSSQAQTNSVGVLPISLGIPQSISTSSSSSTSSHQVTETTNSYLMSSSSSTSSSSSNYHPTPLYTATLYPLSSSATATATILPVTTTTTAAAYMTTNINTTMPYSTPIATTSTLSSTPSTVLNNDRVMTPLKIEKPLYTTTTLPSGKFTNIKNIQALEAVDFHRDAILDAIDKLRERKARPDFERISCLLKRYQNIGYEQTQFCLQRLADAGAVVCVDYKGNLSYRNPSKWRKTAATSGTGNTNLPSVTNKLVEAMRLLIESSKHLLNPSTITCSNLIPYCRPGPNGGYSLFQVERALLYLNNKNNRIDENNQTNSPSAGAASRELTGATLRVCLDREATNGKLAKTIDGRYILDETGERKRLCRKSNPIHPSQMPNKKLLPPNTASSAYLAPSGPKMSNNNNNNKTGTLMDRNPSNTNATNTATVPAPVATLPRLHPLAAKQTPTTSITPSSGGGGRPVNLSTTSNFTMPPLTTTGGRRGRPPGSKAKAKLFNDANSSEKKLKLEIPLSSSSTNRQTLINNNTTTTNNVASRNTSNGIGGISVDTAGVLNTTSSSSCSSSSSSATTSLFIPDTNPIGGLMSTSCFTSNNNHNHTNINDLSFSSSVPILPSSSFITVIASNNNSNNNNNNNCSNLLPGGGTILPTHFSTNSSLSIDSSFMTTIAASPFLSFPLSQGLALPPTLFSNLSNVVSNDLTTVSTAAIVNNAIPQLTTPIKLNNGNGGTGRLSTPDSFMSDGDSSCGTIDKQDEKDNNNAPPPPVCCCCGGLATSTTCEEAFLTCKDCGLHGKRASHTFI